MMKRLLNVAGARSESQERGAFRLPTVKPKPHSLDESVALPSEAESPELGFALLERIGAYGFAPVVPLGTRLSRVDPVALSAH